MYLLFVCFLFLLCFSLSFCFFFCCFYCFVSVCVFCVLSTYVLCVFALQLLPLFNFLCTALQWKIICMSIIKVFTDPIHERIFGFQITFS